MSLKRNSRKQRVYPMMGCSLKKSKRRSTIGRKRTSKRKTQRGGCGSCGSCGGKSVQRGGSCSACGLQPQSGGSTAGFCSTCGMKGGRCGCGNVWKGWGGNSYGPVPAPLVGQPWGASVSKWPGVDGVDSGRNYFTNNLYNHGDPQTAMQLQSGGRGRRSKRIGVGRKTKMSSTNRKKRGGGPLFLGQSLVNLGREMTYSVGSTVNTLLGRDVPVNPLPFKDQFKS